MLIVILVRCVLIQNRSVFRACCLLVAFAVFNSKPKFCIKVKNIEHVHARVVGKMEFWPNLRSTTSATEMREKEHKEFTATKAALEQGMANLRKAIDVHPSIAESPFLPCLRVQTQYY